MKALFIGLTTLDIIYYSNGYPKEDSKTYCEKQIVSPGGLAANAAFAYSALGGEAHLMTCLGINSALSEEVYNQLAEEGVQVKDYAAKGFRSMPVVSVIVNRQNGSRTVINKPVNNVPKPELPENTISVIDFDVVMVDGFYPELALPLIREAKKYHIPVVMDSGSWKQDFEKFLVAIDYLIVSQGLRAPGFEGFEDTYNYLSRFGLKALAFTNGKDPVIGSYAGENFELFPPDIKCVDSLGAGDILHGAFCYYLSVGNDFTHSMEKAMKIASLSCRYEGTREWISHL